MNKNPDSTGPVGRRSIIKGAASAGLISATSVPTILQASESRSAQPELVRNENSKPGTRDWMLTKTRTVPGKINKILYNGRCQQIEGYCNANSIRAGETLQIMVSANPASDFKLEIFRTGYYGGTGARLMKTFETLKAFTQADPSVGENHARECQWEPTVELEIPENWPSGVYLGKMTAQKSGTQSYVIFIIRDDRPCDFLFQCSDLTWSAYNRWPMDYSIYTEHDNGTSIGVPSGTVSFERPYGLFTHPVNRLKNSGGSGEYLPWEFPLAYWMEKHGYDVKCELVQETLLESRTHILQVEQQQMERAAPTERIHARELGESGGAGRGAVRVRLRRVVSHAQSVATSAHTACSGVRRARWCWSSRRRYAHRLGCCRLVRSSGCC